MKPPEQTDAQRKAALEKANEYRYARAAVRRRLKEMDRWEGQQEVARILEAPLDPWMESCKIEYLLMAIHRRGPSWTRRVLAGCNASPRKTLKGLTLRQRACIVEKLHRPLKT